MSFDPHMHSTTLSATPQSELTLRDISASSSRSRPLYPRQLQNTPGTGPAENKGSMLVLRNRKLELELKRKDAEIRKLKLEFEESKQKNVDTVCDLQKEVQRLKEGFLEKEVALERTAEYFSIPLSSVNPTQFSSFNLRQFMGEVVANLFKLNHSAGELWQGVKAFVDGKRPGDVELLSVPVHVPVDIETLNFHEIVRKINVLLGQTQDQMRDSNAQLTRGIGTLRSHLKKPCARMQVRLDVVKEQLARLRKDAADALAEGSSVATELIDKAGSRWVHRVKRAEGSAKRARERASKLEAELADLKQSTAELTKQFREEFEKTAENIAQLEEINAKTQQELEESQAAREADAEQHEEAMQAAADEREARETELTKAATEKQDALQQLVDATTAELDFVEAAREQLQTKLNSQAEALSDLREQQLKIEDELRTEKDRVAALSDKLAEVTSNAQQAAEDAATAAAEAEQRAAEAQAEADAKLSEAAEDKARLGEALEAAWQQRKRLEEALEDANTTIEAKTEQVAKLEEAVTTVAADRASLRDELRQAQEAHAAALQDAAVKLKEANEAAEQQLEQEIARASRELDLVRAEQQKAEESVGELQNENNEMRDQFALLSADLLLKVDDIATKNEELENGNTKLVQEIVDLSDSIGEARQKLKQECENAEKAKQEADEMLAKAKSDAENELAAARAQTSEAYDLASRLETAAKAAESAAAEENQALREETEALKKQQEAADNLLMQRCRALEAECAEKDKTLETEVASLTDTALNAERNYSKLLDDLRDELQQSRLAEATLEAELSGAREDTEAAQEARTQLVEKLAADKALRALELKAAQVDAEEKTAIAEEKSRAADEAQAAHSEMESALRKLRNEFNAQALLVEGAERAEDAKLVQLQEEVKQLAELKADHEASIAKLRAEVDAAKQQTAEQKQKCAALDVVNAALNKELMDSHHLLYKHGRGLDLGLDPPPNHSDRAHDQATPPPIAKRRSPPPADASDAFTSPAEESHSSSVHVSGAGGVSAPNSANSASRRRSPRVSPTVYPSPQDYLVRAAAEATATAQQALDNSIRAQKLAAEAALVRSRRGTPGLDHDTRLASMSLKSLSPETGSVDSVPHYVKDHYPNYHPTGSSSRSPPIQSTPPLHAHDLSAASNSPGTPPVSHHALHTPQKFDQSTREVLGGSSTRQPWRPDMLGTGEYSGSFFNVKKPHILSPPTTAVDYKHPQRRAPSFTIPRNVGESRFIQAGAMDESPIPPLAATDSRGRPLKLVSKSTTHVVMAPTAETAAPADVIELPQDTVLEDDEEIFVGCDDDAESSGGETSNTDPIAAVAAAVFRRGAARARIQPRAKPAHSTPLPGAVANPSPPADNGAVIRKEPATNVAQSPLAPRDTPEKSARPAATDTVDQHPPQSTADIDQHPATKIPETSSHGSDNEFDCESDFDDDYDEELSAEPMSDSSSAVTVHITRPARAARPTPSSALAWATPPRSRYSRNL